MADTRNIGEDDFYERVLQKLIQQGEMGPESTVLVMAAGDRDKRAWQSVGLRNVTISNLDNRMVGNEFSPFQWSYQDAEQIQFDDNTFDYVSIHNGLHHCYCPQRAILEMLRVSRRGVVLFEPYDNLVTRIGCKLGIGQDYETAAVFYNGGTHGGVRNGPVANFVYRFTQNEIRKTVATARPEYPARVQFFHELRIPWEQLKGRKNKIPYWLAVCSIPVIRFITLLFPSQTNCFAAFISKSDQDSQLWPWIQRKADGTLDSNMDWMSAKYRKS